MLDVHLVAELSAIEQRANLRMQIMCELAAAQTRVAGMVAHDSTTDNVYTQDAYEGEASYMESLSKRLQELL